MGMQNDLLKGVLEKTVRPFQRREMAVKAVTTLTVPDDFNHEVWGIEVNFSLPAERVIDGITPAMKLKTAA